MTRETMNLRVLRSELALAGLTLQRLSRRLKIPNSVFSRLIHGRPGGRDPERVRQRVERLLRLRAGTLKAEARP